MPLGALTATYSSLSVSQHRIRITANNIANVNTDGFKKSQTVLSTVQPHGVKGEVEQVETAGPSALEQTAQGEQSIERSNVDIGVEMVNLLSDQRGYKASLRTLKSANEMVGILLDVVADEKQ